MWDVEDPLRPGEPLALKVLRPGRAPAVSELRLGLIVRHPVLIELHEAGRLRAPPGLLGASLPQEVPYLLLERFDGRPLERVEDTRALTAIARRLLGALEAVHTAGWCHGDLHPRNVLVGPACGEEPGDGGPSVRLLDLGLAQPLAPGNERRTGGGTPRYLPPEVLQGATYTESADLYALGAVLLEALRGPGPEPLGDHVVRTVRGEVWRELRESDLPRELGRLLIALLDPDPAARPGTASDALALLDDAAPGPRPRGLAPPGTPAPVGQAPAGAALEAVLRSARADRPSSGALLLEGPPGRGKSRWLREATAEAWTHGLRALPWEALRAAVEEQAPPRPHGDGSEGRVGAGDEDRDGAGVTAPGERRRNRFAREVEALCAALDTAPTLVTVDDLPRRSPHERDLLRGLAERILDPVSRSRGTGGPPVVLALAADLSAAPPGAAALWDELAGRPRTHRVTLPRLDGEEAGRLLDAILRPARALGGLEVRLVERARGEPGRLHGLLVELARTGALRREDGVWRADPREDEPLPDLPGERQAFRRVLDELAPRALETLAAAAALAAFGSEPAVADVAEALGRPSSRVEEAVAGAAARGSPLRTASRPAGRVVEGLDRRRRVAVLRAAGPHLRERIARRLAERLPERPETVWLLLRRQTLPPARIAAAAVPGPAGEAVLRRAASSPRLLPGDAGALSLELGRRMLGRGEARAAEGPLRRAAARLEGEEATWARILTAEAVLGRGDPHGALELLRARDPERSAGAELTARALFLEGLAELRRGRLEAAREAAGRLARERPDLPSAHGLLGAVHRDLGDAERADAAFREGLRRCGDTSRDAAQRAGLETGRARLLRLRGDTGEAAALHARAARRFEAAGRPAEAAVALANLGVLHRRAGQLAEAARAAERVLRIRRGLADDAGVALAEANLGLIARDVGLPGSALRRFAAARAAGQRAGTTGEAAPGEQPLVLEAEALARFETGRDEEAEETAERAAELRRERDALPGPETFLLAVRRVLRRGAQAAPEALRLLERDALPEDAPALFELAAAPWAAAGAAGDPGRRALDALATLAERDRRAAFYLDLARAELGGPEAVEALRRLAERAPSFPEREARRRALARVASAAPDAGTRRTAAEAHRRVVAEVLFDLEPADRDAFRARLEAEAATVPAPAGVPGETESRGSWPGASGLLGLPRELLEARDVDQLLRRAVDGACRMTGAERGFLALRERGGLRIVAARSAGQDLDAPERWISRTLLERAAATGEASIAADAATESGLRSVASVEELGLRSVACVPLRRNGRVAGVLYVDNPFRSGVFDARDLEGLEAFAALATLAWERARDREEREALLRHLRESNRRLGRELDLSRRDHARRSRRETRELEGLVGDSAAMQRVLDAIEAVAPTDFPVLVTGESGTGKELVARAVWRRSARAERPFVAENCAALPAALLESTLFGHVRGAFTGARDDRSGLFALADGGTLFLDEIGELPAGLQASLLRALQEGEIRPLGAERSRNVDVRIVTATNRDPREALASGALRDDLYYRLRGVEIAVPPLRERRDDIPRLVESFLRAAAPEAGEAPRITAEALELLGRHDWPGNVRELENEVRRAVLLAGPGPVRPEHLDAAVRGRSGSSPAEAEAGTIRPLKEVESEEILRALRVLDGHRGRAARALGISRSTLYLKLRQMDEARTDPRRES